MSLERKIAAYGLFTVIGAGLAWLWVRALERRTLSVCTRGGPYSRDRWEEFR